MVPTGRPIVSRILLSAAELPTVQDVRDLLQDAGHSTHWHDFRDQQIADLSNYNLVIFDGSRRAPEALHFCRQIRARLGDLADSFTPILFITGDHSPEARLASFENGADTCILRPFAVGEVLAQTRALLRIKEVHDRLAEKTIEVNQINKRLQQAYQQIDQELELARHIQQSFLPQKLPELAQAEFAVRYMPCGRVGGDFYDVFRLDESHIGFYVADAMGHGVPASLLTIYLKNGVKAKEINGKHYRLIPPNEVLNRLNHDLIEQSLSENPFITMVYGLFDCREKELQFARAGHPYPLHIPAEGELEFCKTEGSVLGVFDTEFPLQSLRLHVGDKVLFYTDGSDQACVEGSREGAASLAACAGHHRHLPLQEFMERLSWDLFRQTEQKDDFTLLALEVKE